MLDDMSRPWFLNLVTGLVMQAGVILFLRWPLQDTSVLIWGGGKSIVVPVSPPPEVPGSRRILALLAVIGGSASLGLMGLVFYTTLVFPQIPREWGGGANPVVEVFLTEKLPVFADRKDVPSTTDGRRIGPVICILETDRTLIVAPLKYPPRTTQHHGTIAVDRKVVTAVVYEGPSSDFGGSDSDRSEISNNRHSSTSPSPVAASPHPTSPPPVDH